jgi:hypothetical protein
MDHTQGATAPKSSEHLPTSAGKGEPRACVRVIHIPAWYILGSLVSIPVPLLPKHHVWVPGAGLYIARWVRCPGVT